MNGVRRTNRRSSIIILLTFLFLAIFAFAAPRPATALDLGVTSSGKWINAIPAGSSTTWLIGEGTDTFTWGDPASFGTGANWIRFQGASQSLAYENLSEPVKLGTVTYFNGTVSIGTEAEGITLEITVDVSPFDLRMTFTYPAAIVTTANSSSATAAQNADYISFHSLSPEESIDLGGGNKVALKIWGFYQQDAAGGYDLTDDFHVNEGATTSADLYGQFEITTPTALSVTPTQLTVEALYSGGKADNCSATVPGHEEIITIKDGTSPFTVKTSGTGQVYADVIGSQIHVYGKQAGSATLTVTDGKGATANIPVTVIDSHISFISEGVFVIPYLSVQGVTYSASFQIKWDKDNERLEVESLVPKAGYTGAYSDDMAQLTGDLANLVLTVPNVYVVGLAYSCPMEFSPAARFALTSMNPITFTLQK